MFDCCAKYILWFVFLFDKNMSNNIKKRKPSGHEWRQIRKRKKEEEERESGRLQFMFRKAEKNGNMEEPSSSDYDGKLNGLNSESSEAVAGTIATSSLLANIAQPTPVKPQPNKIAVAQTVVDLEKSESAEVVGTSATCTAFHLELTQPTPEQPHPHPDVEKPVNERSPQEHLDAFDDVANWPAILSPKIFQIIIEKGPKHIHLQNYPVKKSRKFSNKFYSKVSSNGNVIFREWLVYSVSSDRVFCFCCRLFASNRTFHLVTVGFSDWAHAQSAFQQHENSDFHMKSFIQWKEFKARLESNSTVDSNFQRAMDVEVCSWREVLKRIVTLVTFLGTQSLSFRGTSEHLYEENNGNFLKLIESVAKFDITLGNHLKK